MMALLAAILFSLPAPAATLVRVNVPAAHLSAAVPHLSLPQAGLSAANALAPSLPALSHAPLPPSAPAPWLAPLGTPGPGVSAEHVAAVQAMADRTGLTVFVHGSRQTGVRHRDGAPFRPDTDLDLGVVGAPESIFELTKVDWDGIPNVKHGPMWIEPTVEEAVGKGHLVFTPRRPLAHHDEVARLASPLSTARQLAAVRATPKAPGETVRFSVIGDAEPGRFWVSRALFGADNVFWKLLARADAARPDFILQLGDLVSVGKAALFRRVFEGLRAMALKTPFLTIIGNHDRHKPHGVTNDKLFRRYWGSPDWVLDRGDWRFISVDSSAGRITSEQLDWLDRQLIPGKRFIVFTHIPPAPLGEFTDFGALKGAGGFKPGAERFMRLMSERGVERVYMGHVHGLGVVRRGGVTYVLSGGGGSPLYPTTKLRALHHRLEVEAGPEGVRETVHPLHGRPWDLGTGSPR